MLQELKVRIDNYREIEEKLKNLGALFLEEISFTDTYFNSAKGQVSKITEDTTGDYQVRLQTNNGKFNELINEKIHDLANAKAQLTSELGIKRILKGKRRNFTYHDLKLTINLIDGLGEFLILTSENPQEEFVTGVLDIKNPEYITVSFDRL